MSKWRDSSLINRQHIDEKCIPIRLGFWQYGFNATDTHFAGLDANALQRPKRFFSATRNVAEGNSLTFMLDRLKAIKNSKELFNFMKH